MRAAVWLLPLLALPACGGGAAAAPPAPPPRRVQLLSVGTIELARAIEVTGSLAAQEQLELGMQVGGRLVRLAIDVGDRVTAGQELAALDAQDFELQRERAAAAWAVAQARLGVDIDAPDALEQAAAVREAQAVLRESKLQQQRLADMVQQSLRAQADLDAAEAAVAVAESRLQRAQDDVRTGIAEVRQRKAEFAQAEKDLQDARLLAPWNGRVARRHVAAGQVVTPGATVVTLLRTDPLRLRLQVPERLLGEVAVGQTVEFEVDGALRSGAHTGKVVRLGAEIERQGRTLLVEAEVANADGALLPGGFCRARIVVAPAEPVVAIPRAALLSFAGIDRVFTVQDGKAKATIVRLGRSQGDLVEVRDGVAAGVQIVAEPRGLVQDAAVTVGS